MADKHAILGSRGYPDLDRVVERVRDLAARQGTGWILVSGGSQGACQAAEAEFLRLGGRVLSLRPRRLRAVAGEPAYGVYEHRCTPGRPDVVIRHLIEFADFRSAAMYRSMLMAERSDHGDLFWDGRSFGARAEIDFFAAADTPLKVFRAE